LLFFFAIDVGESCRSLLLPVRPDDVVEVADFWAARAASCAGDTDVDGDGDEDPGWPVDAGW
jgi:hypothetical protein